MESSTAFLASSESSSAYIWSGTIETPFSPLFSISC
jgi:hypothetical protein